MTKLILYYVTVSILCSLIIGCNQNGKKVDGRAASIKIGFIVKQPG